jgi:uncharacterized protein YjbI with pentapeptide repeats
MARPGLDEYYVSRSGGGGDEMTQDGKKCGLSFCGQDRWRDDARCLFHSAEIAGKREDLAAAIEALLSKHRIWLESNGERGERLDLYEPNLSEFDFRGMNLSQALLEGANLYHCDCRNADFSGVDLYGANLRQADFSGGNLRGAHLNGCYMEAASFIDAELTEADISDSNLTSTDFSGAIMRRANLRGSGCWETVFPGADLSEADLSYAAIWRTVICSANLRDANLTGANMQGALYLRAVKLLEAKSLYGIAHLDVTQLSDYRELSAEEKARLDQLLRTKLE